MSAITLMCEFGYENFDALIIEMIAPLETEKEQ